MESDREVPEMHAEARKAEENGFPGDGMNEVDKGFQARRISFFRPVRILLMNIPGKWPFIKFSSVVPDDRSTGSAAGFCPAFP